MAGPKVQEKVDSARNIVNNALKNPTVVGQNNANTNA